MEDNANRLSRVFRVALEKCIVSRVSVASGKLVVSDENAEL